MNTYEEYELAQHICTTYLSNCQKYFEHIYLVINSNNQHRLLRFVFDKYHSLRWHEQLLKHYDKKAFINCISKVFDENELPFVIKDNKIMNMDTFLLQKRMILFSFGDCLLIKNIVEIT